MEDKGLSSGWLIIEIEFAGVEGGRRGGNADVNQETRRALYPLPPDREVRSL